MKNEIKVYALLIILSTHTGAISLFAGPSNIIFDDMIQGQSLDKTVFVSTEGNDELSIKIWIEDPLKDWVTIAPLDFNLDEDRKFKLPSKSKLDFNLSVKLPDKIDTGIYTGNILLRVDPLITDAGGTGLIIIPGMALKITVNVTNQLHPKIKVVDVTVNDVKEEEPIEFKFTAINEGNVEIEPTIKVAILNLTKTEISKVEEYTVNVLRKKGDQRFNLNLSSEGIKAGQYHLGVATYLGDEPIWNGSPRFNVINPIKYKVTTIPQTTTSTEILRVEPPTKNYRKYILITIFAIIVVVWGYLRYTKSK